MGQTEGQDALVIDLLMHMPSAVIDRRKEVPIAEAYLGDIVTLDIHIDRHLAAPRGKSAAPHRVYAHDETGEVQLVFFRAEGGWVERALRLANGRIVSGEIGFFQGLKQITHPDYIVEPDQARHAAPGRTGLSADPRPVVQGIDQADAAGGIGTARHARMDKRLAARDERLAGLFRSHARRPRARVTARRLMSADRRAPGSPMTNTWPGS